MPENIGITSIFLQNGHFILPIKKKYIIPVEKIIYKLFFLVHFDTKPIYSRIAKDLIGCIKQVKTGIGKYISNRWESIRADGGGMIFGIILRKNYLINRYLSC